MVNKKDNYPFVALIILSYNSKQWFHVLFESLKNTKYSNYKIFLVDNNSSDNSLEYVEKYHSDVYIIKNNKNYGWCKANNIGISIASKYSPDYFMFLNSDLNFFDPNWLYNLVIFAESHPLYAIYGCTQFNYDNEEDRSINDWTKYILDNGENHVFHMHMKNKSKESYCLDDLYTKDYLDCTFVQGAAMMVKSSLFEKIGCFDTIYFIFYDEIDFSRRAEAIGEKTALICNSYVKHFSAGDTKDNNKLINLRNFYFYRNKYIYLFTDKSLSLNNIYLIFKDFINNDINIVLKDKNKFNSIKTFMYIFISILIKIPRIFIKRNFTYLYRRLYNA